MVGGKERGWEKKRVVCSLAYILSILNCLLSFFLASFFSLMSGRIPSLKDDIGAVSLSEVITCQSCSIYYAVYMYYSICMHACIHVPILVAFVLCVCLLDNFIVDFHWSRSRCIRSNIELHENKKCGFEVIYVLLHAAVEPLSCRHPCDSFKRSWKCPHFQGIAHAYLVHTVSRLKGRLFFREFPLFQSSTVFAKLC